MNFPPQIDFAQNTSNTTSMPRLPTYEEATGRVKVSLRLPSYREGFGRRYHPYRRSSILPDPIARLMYTTLDDEYIELYGIPPALPPRPVPPLVPGPLVLRPRDYVLQMERRARLNMMILVCIVLVARQIYMPYLPPQLLAAHFANKRTKERSVSSGTAAYFIFQGLLHLVTYLVRQLHCLRKKGVFDNLQKGWVTTTPSSVDGVIEW